jgi:hypothetical protein
LGGGECGVFYRDKGTVMLGSFFVSFVAAGVLC